MKPRASTSSWRPSRSPSSAARAGSGRPRWRPRRRRWPPPGSAARSWSSPSTPPSAWPTPSASRRWATWSGPSPPTGSRPPAWSFRRRFSADTPGPGLWAAMLDTKQSWDDLVLRHARDEETAYRILENRLYHNLTARFVQSHDYIAMERLHEIHAEGGYDLIVVDTPPSRNALDFLEAPGADGRLLRQPAAAVAHDAVPGRRPAGRPDGQPGQQALLPGGRPDPRRPVPGGHRRVLPQLPVDVRRAS